MKKSFFIVKKTFHFTSIALIALLCINISNVSAENINAAGSNAHYLLDTERYVTIDFDDVDIKVVVKFIGELTGTNFLIDPRVKGKVSIISPERISSKEAYNVFESVLEIHGYTAVKAGSVTKIVPISEAKTRNIETNIKEGTAGKESDKIITQIVRLKFASTEDIQKLFTPLMSKTSSILSYASSNTLIITDVYSNLKRLLKILKVIDVEGMGQELTVIPLKYASADKVISVLKSVFNQTGTKKKSTENSIEFVSYERTNSIVVLASEVDTKKVKALIELLDKQIPRGKTSIHVCYLEHATAEDLAAVLNALPSQTKTGDGAAEAPVVSEEVKITPDKATNSLIITADEDDYVTIEAVIKQLDIPRSMVYIEAVIMEVNFDSDFGLGTEFSAAGKTTVGGSESVFGGGFSGGRSDSAYSGISSLSGGTWPDGFSLGIFSEAITIAGVDFSNLSGIITAYKEDENVHILSTPQILTTDNEEATIVAGKTVPYQTQSHASGTTDTYSSYEYKDVGITLTITPQISKDRLVRLKIAQEVNKLADANSETLRPTTLKRSIETTVIVEDKSTVVIGGLIDESLSETAYKVPCLGDIPFIGWLFKSFGKNNSKTNLFVFLTPHVIKSPAEAQVIYEEKNESIKKSNGGTIKMYK